MLLKVKAPAKINIGLKIIGRRSDGYHDILSIFQTVTLFDELSAELSGEPGLFCDNPDIPTNNANLVLKAENEFLHISGLNERAKFYLKKAIPSGAGLGGGSSDGAAALRVINKLHNEVLSEREIISCAERLGSDVPFLVNGGTAVVSGRGEKIEPVKWPFDFIYLLVYPGFPVSTSWAYKNLKKTGRGGEHYLETVNKLKEGHIERDDLIKSIENDFEEKIFNAYPVLTEIKETILKNGALTAFMSGSGSTIVGLFDDNEKARSCADKFKENLTFSLFITEAYNGTNLTNTKLKYK